MQYTEMGKKKKKQGRILKTEAAKEKATKIILTVGSQTGVFLCATTCV